MGLTPSKESFQSVECSNANLQRAILSELQKFGGSKIIVSQSTATNKCLVTYEKRTSTGLVTSARRIATIDPTTGIVLGPEMADVRNVSMESVEEYYTRLRVYNDGWNRSGWRTAYTVPNLRNTLVVLYDPPRPSWVDTLFERNIEIYNNNLRAVGGPNGVFSASSIDALSASVFKDNFQRFIAPTPAEPVPPPSKNVIGRVPPVSLPPGVQAQIDNERGAADNNMNADRLNKQLYDSLVPPGDPQYDPPIATDDYETVLIKFNVAYDIAAGRRAGSVPITGITPSPYDRRLRGRTIMPNVDAPEVIMRPRSEGWANPSSTHGFIPFTERQKYLIDYSPFTSRELLRSRMCVSMGYLPYTDELVAKVSTDYRGDMSAENGCFVEFPAAPQHIPGSASAARAQTKGPRLEFVPPYTPPRKSPLAAMCPSGSCGPAPVAPAQPGVPQVPASQPPRKCPETTIRGKTVYVPSRPKNVETSRKIITYRMGAPVGDCPITGTMTANGQTTGIGLFN